MSIHTDPKFIAANQAYNDSVNELLRIKEEVLQPAMVVYNTQEAVVARLRDAMFEAFK